MRCRMRLGRALLWTSLLYLGLLATHAAAQGWIITMQTDEGQVTLSLHEQWGAKMTVEGQPGYMIVRADRQQTIMVDTEDNTHAIIPQVSAKQSQHMANDMRAQAMQNLPPHVREQIMQSIAQAQQQMQHKSPQERAQMEQMLQRQMGLLGTPPPQPKQIEYKVMGERQKINGFDTQRVVKYEDGQQTEELWVAKVKDWQRLAKAFDHAFQHQDEAHRIPYEQVGGVPIKSGTIEVRSIQPATLTEKDFLPPSTSQPNDVMPMPGPRAR